MERQYIKADLSPQQVLEQAMRNSVCGGGVSASKPMEMPQIEDAFTRLDTAIVTVQKSSEALINRIELILRPQNPSKCQENVGAVPEPVRAPLAERINNLAAELRMVNVRLDDTLRRVEL